MFFIPSRKSMKKTAKVHKSAMVQKTAVVQKKSRTDRKPKRKRKKREGNFGIYIYRVLKELHHDRSISVKAMAAMNSFMSDCFHRIASEASRLIHYNNRSTMTINDVQTAVRLVLPGELGKHAISEGIKAMVKYERSK